MNVVHLSGVLVSRFVFMFIRLRAHNTLFWKTLECTLGVDEHVRFIAINRAGFGTYSARAFFIGFLGAGPFCLTFEREHLGAHGP